MCREQIEILHLHDCIVFVEEFCRLRLLTNLAVLTSSSLCVPDIEYFSNLESSYLFTYLLNVYPLNYPSGPKLSTGLRRSAIRCY